MDSSVKAMQVKGSLALGDKAVIKTKEGVDKMKGLFTNKSSKATNNITNKGGVQMTNTTNNTNTTIKGGINMTNNNNEVTARELMISQVKEILMDKTIIQLSPVVNRDTLAQVIVTKLQALTVAEEKGFTAVVRDEVKRVSDEVVSIARCISNGQITNKHTAKEIVAMYKAANYDMNIDKVILANFTLEEIDRLTGSNLAEQVKLAQEKADQLANTQLINQGGMDMKNTTKEVLVSAVSEGLANNETVTISAEKFQELINKVAQISTLSPPVQEDVAQPTIQGGIDMNINMTEEMTALQEAIAVQAALMVKHEAEAVKVEKSLPSLARTHRGIVKQCQTEMDRLMGKNVVKVSERVSTGIDSIGKYTQDKVAPTVEGTMNSVVDATTLSAKHLLDGGMTIGTIALNGTGQILGTAITTTGSVAKEVTKASGSIISGLAGLLRK